MKPLTYECTIDAPIDRVWGLLTDIQRRAELFSKVDAVQLFAVGPFGLGTRWRETRTVYGRSASADHEVVEFEPSRRFLTESMVGARATMEYLLTPAQDGTSTTVHVTFETTGGSLIYKLTEGLSRSRITRCSDEHNTQDLADLANACEP